MKRTRITELAWAAGIFDGEGCCFVGSNGHPPYLNVAQAGTDFPPELLTRFKTVVGYGKIYGPYKRAKAHHKKRWNWIAKNLAETNKTIELLRPFLGRVKLAQIANSFARYRRWKKTHMYEGWEIVRTCNCGRKIRGVAFYKHSKACQRRVA